MMVLTQPERARDTIAVFDLDGTLAESKAAIDKEMAERLAALLTVAKVGIISGGD